MHVCIYIYTYMHAICSQTQSVYEAPRLFLRKICLTRPCRWERMVTIGPRPRGPSSACRWESLIVTIGSLGVVGRPRGQGSGSPRGKEGRMGRRGGVKGGVTTQVFPSTHRQTFQVVYLTSFIVGVPVLFICMYSKHGRTSTLPTPPQPLVRYDSLPTSTP